MFGDARNQAGEAADGGRNFVGIDQADRSFTKLAQ
jgi:hypothetical protein